MHSWFILIGLALVLLAGFGGSLFGNAWGPLQQIDFAWLWAPRCWSSGSSS
jgi:hypothetical protein